MENYPLISVVMSVYNAEKYLDEAIESVLDQTYKNFEFIIINDGSTDSSLNIIKKYQEQDDRIILISRENKGLVASLNEGIEKAKGEYIARMDADDICILSRFEEQIDFMNKKNIDICGSWVQTFNRNKKYDIFRYPKDHKDIVFRLFFKSSFAHPSIMIRKNVFEFFKYSKEVAEDYKLWCDLISNGFKAGNIQKVLLNYRIHEAQITQTKQKELDYNVNNLRLNFVTEIDKSFLNVVEKTIYLQKKNNIKEFRNVLQNVINYAATQGIDEENLKCILKDIYNRVFPRTVFIYYTYYSITKKYDKNIKEEIILILKSLMSGNKNSKIYFIFKRIYNRFFYA